MSIEAIVAAFSFLCWAYTAWPSCAAGQGLVWLGTVFWPLRVPEWVYRVQASCHPRRGCHNWRGWYERAGDESASLALLFEETFAETLAGVYTLSVFCIVKPWCFWFGTETPTFGLNILSYYGLSSWFTLTNWSSTSLLNKQANPNKKQNFLQLVRFSRVVPNLVSQVLQRFLFCSSWDPCREHDARFLSSSLLPKYLLEKNAFLICP